MSKQKKWIDRAAMLIALILGVYALPICTLYRTGHYKQLPLGAGVVLLLGLIYLVPWGIYKLLEMRKEKSGEKPPHSR